MPGRRVRRSVGVLIATVTSAARNPGGRSSRHLLAQYRSLPSWPCGFDPRRPLRNPPGPGEGVLAELASMLVLPQRMQAGGEVGGRALVPGWSSPRTRLARVKVPRRAGGPARCARDVSIRHRHLARYSRSDFANSRTGGRRADGWDRRNRDRETDTPAGPAGGRQECGRHPKGFWNHWWWCHLGCAWIPYPDQYSDYSRGPPAGSRNYHAAGRSRRPPTAPLMTLHV